MSAVASVPEGWVWSDHCCGLRHVATGIVVKVEDGLLCSDGPRSIPVDVAAYVLRRHEQDEREAEAECDGAGRMRTEAPATVADLLANAARNVLGVALWIDCKDGSRLSVIAGRTCYCTPRDDAGPWTAVEVGSWVAAEALTAWVDGAPSPGENPLWVYGYVPVEAVDEEIQRRSGLESVTDRRVES